MAVREYGHYINGQWVPSEGGQWFDTVSPTTGDVLARFPKGTRADVVKAIDAAEAAFSDLEARLHHPSAAKFCCARLRSCAAAKMNWARWSRPKWAR